MLGPFLSQVILLNDVRGCTYYELYCGGAGAGLYLLFNDLVGEIVINDADFRIYSFWDAILNKTSEFLTQIDRLDVNIDSWHRYKEIYDKAESEDPFDVGIATFYLNRTNRSGILHRSGPIGGFEQTGKYLIDVRFNKDALKARIKKIAQKGNLIKIYNKTAETFIENANNLNSNSFYYLDPPYYNKGRKLYLNNYSHDEHQQMANLLTTKPMLKWLVSYDNADAIKKMYTGFRQTTFGLNYSLQNKRKGSELLVFSNSIEVPSSMKINGNKTELILN